MFSTVKMPKCLRHHMNLITVDPMFYVSRLMVWLPRTEKCRQAQARPAENMNGYIVLLTCTNLKKEKKQLHCPCNSRLMNINIMNIFFNLHAPFFKNKIFSLYCKGDNLYISSARDKQPDYLPFYYSSVYICAMHFLCKF